MPATKKAEIDIPRQASDNCLKLKISEGVAKRVEEKRSLKLDSWASLAYHARQRLAALDSLAAEKEQIIHLALVPSGF